MRWKRIIGWTAATLGILIVIGVVGGLLFLRTESFRQVAIRTIVKDVDESTGGRAKVRNFDFQLSTLTARLYDITIHGHELASQPPLLHVDKLTVGLTIPSILRRKVNLKELSIEHPVVHVWIDHEGKSNLPQSPQKQSSSNTSVFDLAVGHVKLSNGEADYNDATIPVNADLYGLKTEIRFEPIGTRYRGSISYDSGRLRYGAEPVFVHSLNAKFSATRSALSLESALLRIGSSSASLHADLTDYSNPTVEGHYEVRVHTQDFAAMMQPAATTGDVSLNGTLHYQSAAGQPLLRNVWLDGQIASDELIASSSQGRIDVRRLEGRYQLRAGTFQAHQIGFETLGGKIITDVNVENLGTTAEGRVHTTLKGISLQAAQRALHMAEAQRVALVSRIDGTVDASWAGSVKNIRARTDLALKAASGSVAQMASTVLPVNGSIHGTYDGQRSVVTFRETSLRIPPTTVALEGELSNRSNLTLQADTTDLHQVAALFSAVHGGQPLALQIAGSASAKAAVKGSMRKPELSGQFSAHNLQVQGSDWSSAKFGVEADPSQISLHDAELVNAHQGRASGSAKIALQHWSYVPSSPIAVNLSVQRMSVADLQRLADVRYPVSGELSADIAVHGSQLNPVGKGSARLDNGRAYDEPIQRLSVDFSAGKNSMTSTLQVSLPAGSANGTVTYTPQTKGYVVRLSAPSVTLQKLHALEAKNLGISGKVAASAQGEGTLDDPQLTASLELPELQLRDKSISQIRAQLQVANRRAQLTVNSQVGQASVQSKAETNLSGDYYTEAAIDTTGVPLGPLLAMYLPSLPQEFQGETELHATLKGPLKDKSRIDAHITVPTLKASYQSLEIGAASPIRADYSNSVVTLQPAEIRGTGTSLRIQGRIPLGGSAPATLTAQGSIDVQILRIINPDVQAAGSVALDIRASGSADRPEVQGQVHLQEIAASTPSAPLGVQKLNGTLDINNNTLQISKLTGEVGGGQVSLGGSVSYKPNLQFNVTLQSKSVRLRYPDGLRALLDGNLLLSGTRDESTLNGRILIDSLSFTPDFDLAKFSDQFSGSTVPSQPGLADNVKLAIDVQSKSNLSATSSQISVEGQVNFQVIGTAANPVIVGRTDLTSGELFYRNVRYQLQRGIITFDDPTQTAPTLNVTVTTAVEQYNLTLTLRGPFDKLTTVYTSDPPLATADIINLIASGKTTQEANAAGQSTDSMIASAAASKVTGDIQHLAGISSLQVDPLLGGNNQNPSARVALQQRVTRNFLFTFSTDLSQPGSEVVQGDYQINKRWSVSVTRDEVGGVSVDGKYHTKF
jgi:translocation and assembly module TamB